MGFEFIPWSEEKLQAELAKYPHIDTPLTTNPHDWTFSLNEADEENEEPSTFFFEFKNGKWDAFVPFDFKQNGRQLYYDTEMELFASEFDGEEDDVDPFFTFLEDCGFSEA